jgi:hypothetical protein
MQQLTALPVPLPFKKSPPWHMNWGIWAEEISKILIHYKDIRRDLETHDPMKFGALVAMWLTARIFGFSSAELAEILSRLRGYVVEELEGDAAEGFA